MNDTTNDAPVTVEQLARSIFIAINECDPAIEADHINAAFEGRPKCGGAWISADDCRKAATVSLAALASAPAWKLNWDFTARRIKELMDEGDGFWRACSGCQEGEDGYVSERDYPFDPLFRCQPGGGCSECGGIGVLWDGGRGYDDITGDEEPPSAPAGDGVEEAEPLGWLVEWSVAGQDWVEAFACEVNAVDKARAKNGKCTPLYPALARPRAAVAEQGKPQGLDVDGICDDHGRFGCQRCVEAFEGPRATVGEQE